MMTGQIGGRPRLVRLEGVRKCLVGFVILLLITLRNVVMWKIDKIAH